MSRSLKKPVYIDVSVMESVKNRRDLQRKGDDSWNKVIKTYSRATTIVPEMVGLKFAVHNGKEFPVILITDDKIGHKLGEFVFTRKFAKHGGQKKLAQGKSSKPGQKPKK